MIFRLASRGYPQHLPRQPLEHQEESREVQLPACKEGGCGRIKNNAAKEKPGSQFAPCGAPGFAELWCRGGAELLSMCVFQSK